MSEANKNVVRRLFEEVWNKSNLPVAEEVFAPSYVHHDPATPDVGRGPESEKKKLEKISGKTTAESAMWEMSTQK